VNVLNCGLLLSGAAIELVNPVVILALKFPCGMFCDLIVIIGGMWRVLVIAAVPTVFRSSWVFCSGKASSPLDSLGDEAFEIKGEDTKKRLNDE